MQSPLSDHDGLPVRARDTGLLARLFPLPYTPDKFGVESLTVSPVHKKVSDDRERLYGVAEQPESSLLLDTHTVGMAKWYYGDSHSHRNSQRHGLEFVAEGAGMLRVDGRSWRLAKGDVVILKPNQNQRLQACRAGRFVRFFMEFWPRSFARVLAVLNLSDTTFIRLPDNQVNHMRDLFERAWRLGSMKPPGYRIDLAITATEILQRLACLDRARASAPVSDTIMRALTFAVQHLDKRVRIAQMATAAAASISTLDRVFRSKLKTTPHQWLERFKLYHACNRLRLTTTTISIIAERLGYHDVSDFSRVFKRVIGMSPQAYRTTSRKSTITKGA